MNKQFFCRILAFSFVTNLIFLKSFLYAQVINSKPNIIFILADDLGYGDVSSYGATKIHTPNIDALANQGIRFTNAHATASTCTPSRYSLMTGKYAFRKNGTGILPGDAALIIPTDKVTLPNMLKHAGYTTGLVGKWHLGLGEQVQKNWNKEIKPGPNEVGFDYAFFFPATADRVPTVFIENNKVAALESNDTIEVNYNTKIGNEPTGAENPELLKMQASSGHGHNNTIVNGIGRIGFMKGGKTARWADEELSLTFLSKAKAFIDSNKSHPFFLYFTPTEPHVPRMPATIFKGKSGLGFRGDAILQLDWTVGEITKKLKESGIDKNTIIIFSSDNGPVLDDGYQDGAVTQQNGHTPWGPLRGGKYSAFEAGTRIPFIIKWPKETKPQVSDALVNQIDMLASFAKLTGQQVPDNTLDSRNELNTWLGKDIKGRTSIVEQGGTLAIVSGTWKYIQPSNGEAKAILTNIELGNNKLPQLYDLTKDIGETNNVAAEHPDIVNRLAKELAGIINDKKL